MIKNILVTGASGFIGKNLCDFLSEQSYIVKRLTSSDGDITEKSTLSSIKDVDFVFHLAGKTYVPDSWNKPTEFHRVNILGTSNVLEFCRINNIPLIYVSAYIYGIPEQLPVSENALIRPSNPYALSKYFAEELCKFYSKNFDSEITIVRPFNIYGPGQKSDFLIPTVVRQAVKGNSIEIKDIKPKRDYLYIDDLVLALLKAMNNMNGLNIYNLGSGYSLSIKEIINVLEQALGKNLEVKCNNQTRGNEIMDVVADINKATRELDWEPIHTFEIGIENMISMENLKHE
ncbi:MAG: NAD(P)-dependent oxidoreductase [Endozoicomonadaceae bacterium]|nr:NAD(P)-dependent oxidoreductase [Endozoicomonadaceae bacterium]